MTEDRDTRLRALDRARWPLRLTRAGMLAERLTRGFWPVWTILFLVVAAFAFGVQDNLPLEALWAGMALAGLAIGWALLRGFRRFRWPGLDEAVDRLDRTLPGRPLTALTDEQALGRADAAAVAVWRVHLERMAQRLRLARPVAPDLRISGRDPFALRYTALTALVTALLFGSVWRVAEMGDLAAGSTPASAAAGPAWEGWVEPPAYTGKPSLYLNGIEATELTVPEGSRVTLRLYGEPGSIEVSETVSGRPAGAGLPPEPEPGPDAAVQPAAAGPQALEFEALQDGTLRIEGPGGRSFDLTVLPDAAPAVAYAGEPNRAADGEMTQPFTARDDHAVIAGRAEIALDLAAVPRRFGLAPEPEPREALVFDLPMPISGSRAEFAEALVENASKHPWANLPVRMTFTAEDARAQSGSTEAKELSLPGRRFFDPLAAALIELRRDLLWTRDNGPRVAQLLRAITHRPEGFMRNERAYLMLRVAMRHLDSGLGRGPLPAELRDETAEALWEIAVLVEDGGLSDALERMRRAQERLSEAIRNGASPEEIQQLMDELRQATNDYIRHLAERAESAPEDFAENMQGQQLTGDMLQQMMDEIQRLMEEGRMAEAQELLDQLSRMMENLRVTQGGNGEGMQMPGQQAMRDLQDTLRQQQGLSDEAFRDLQRQFGQQPGQGEEGEGGQQPGQQPGQQQGQQGQGEGQDQRPGQGAGNLADRQQALRDQLRRQQGALPGTGTEEGEAARRSLDQAGRAMGEAEQALREGDMGRAIDRQAEAIEQLREGMRSLGEAMAREQGQQGNQGDAQGRADNLQPRDPLGRNIGEGGRIGTDQNMLQGQDVYRRARDLLDEIRRRSGDQERPQLELDYLRRLLDRF